MPEGSKHPAGAGGVLQTHAGWGAGDCAACRRGDAAKTLIGFSAAERKARELVFATSKLLNRNFDANYYSISRVGSRCEQSESRPAADLDSPIFSAGLVDLGAIWDSGPRLSRILFLGHENLQNITNLRKNVKVFKFQKII